MAFYMCELDLEREVGYSELDAFIEGFGSGRGTLIAVLQKAQQIYGYLPETVLRYIAGKLDIPASKIYGVVTFYSNFTTERKGRHQISVCLGTACYVRGAQDVLAAFEDALGIKKGEVTEDGLFSLDSLRCVGACGLAPVVMVDGKAYGKVGAEDVERIISEYRERALEHGGNKL